MKIEIKRTPKKRRKGVMSRWLVIYCIFVLTATLVWAGTLKTIDHTIDISDVLTFVGAAYGGELLLLAFKRVFAKSSEDKVQEKENAGTDDAVG